MIYKEKTEIFERAIVFTTYSVKEKNKIVNFFLEKSNSLVSVNVFGFHSKKNNYKSILQPMSLVDLHLIKKKNDNWNIVDVKLADSFENLKKDYSKIELVLRIFKTVENFPYKQSEIFNNVLYQLFIKLLKYCEQNGKINLRVLELFFYYYFIYSLGYKLNVNSLCSKCNEFDFNNKKNLSKAITFDYDNGNLLCEDCRIKEQHKFYDTRASYIKISNSTFNLLQRLENIKFNQLSNLNDYKVDKMLFEEIKRIYEYYLRYHLNKRVFL